MSDPVPLVTVLSRPACHLCDEAKALLRQLQAVYRFTLCEVDITEHPELERQYGEEVPVVFINGRKAFKYRVDPQQFVRRLQRGAGRWGWRRRGRLGQ